MSLNFDSNEALRDAEFKDESPLKTVDNIKGILRDNGIETEEIWMESGVPYCYSIRVNVKGTTFGVNGKGMNRDFTLASGYGELMERLQLGLIQAPNLQKDGVVSIKNRDAIYMKSEDLMQKYAKWYESYSECVKFLTGDVFSAEYILKQHEDHDGKIEVSPYFCINTRAKEFLPTALCKTVYSTNGCAAGNTPEEAIVQAISEIVERKHRLRIFTENIEIPDIPDSVLKKYSASYEIISYLQSRSFEVTVKDCSLGTKFPCVCVCIIDRNTGKYHIHFGAYPIFEIALERALTESFQGKNIETLIQTDDFIYEQETALFIKSISIESGKGIHKIKPKCFIKNPNNVWNENVGFLGRNNKELFKECVEFFTEQGFDILLRDCSCLGFPTYQVIVPGYSELFGYRLITKFREFRNLDSVARVFRNPATASVEDMIALNLYIDENKQIKNLGLTSFQVMSKLPINAANEDKKIIEKLYLSTLGYVFYTFGKYGVTNNYIQQMIAVSPLEEQEYVICLKRYLSLKSHNYEKNEIKQILEMFHKPETVKELFSCIEKKRNPLEKFTLHCGGKCDENCPLKHCCCEERTGKIADLIDSKVSEMDFDASVQKLLKIL